MKIQRKKVIISFDRIMLNKKSIGFLEIKVVVKKYISLVAEKALDRNEHNEFNKTQSFELFGLKLTVNELFELYNYSAESQGLRAYTKLWYDPKNSLKIKFCQKHVYADRT